GTHQEGTSRVFFPADDFCVYVLDVAKKVCEAVLYTEHPSGSLRGAPIVAGSDDPAAPQGLLILAQADGLKECQLRVFGLPIKDAHDKPLSISPPPQVHGWPWFQPFSDGEKLALATDAGMLGLFG